MERPLSEGSPRGPPLPLYDARSNSRGAGCGCGLDASGPRGPACDAPRLLLANSPDGPYREVWGSPRRISPKALRSPAAASPVPQRRCTDGACAVFFGTFLYGLWFTYSCARREGDLAKLTHGFDWKGDICGVDAGVEHLPLLYWCAPPGVSDADWDGLRLIDGICVDRCPEGPETSSWCPGPARKFEHQRREWSGEGLRRQVVIGEVRNLTRRADYSTTSALGYCFPKQDVKLMRRIMQDSHISSVTKQLYVACHGALESWRFLLFVAVASVVIGYGFLFVLWLCFAQLIYTLVLGAHMLLAGCCYVCVMAGLHKEHNFFASYLSEDTSQALAWTCLAVASVVWVLFCILCYYCRSSLKVMIDSVRVTCEVVASIPSMLLQPFVHSVATIAGVLVLLYGFAWILSTGRVVPVTSPIVEAGIELEGVQRNLMFTPRQWGYIAYWIFGIVWTFETFNALGQFAISHAVVAHARLRKSEDFPMFSAYSAGFRFHLGTLAFGGFTIGCLKLLIALLTFLVRQTWDQHGTPNIVARAACCCCVSCISCIEKILEMVNDLIYADVALSGSCYGEAAVRVVRAISGCPAAYTAVKSSAMAVRILGVTTIGGLGTFLSYRALSSHVLRSELRELDGVFEEASNMLTTSSVLGATVASAFVCFHVALAFMMVFYQTTHTLMYCMLLEDRGQDDSREIKAGHLLTVA